MGLMISAIDTTIKIPANFKRLTGKEPLVIEMIANIPKELPDNIVEYYTKNRSKVFRREWEPEPEKIQGGDPAELLKGFDAKIFIADNYENIEFGIEHLEEPVRPKLIKIANFLRFNNYVKQKTDRIKERIINDIRAKKELEEKLTKQNPE